MCRSVTVFFVTFAALLVQSQCKFYIADFQKDATTSVWSEHSDTVMREGKSKASFVLHESGTFRRAVLFTMLNPQPCGAALAGIKKNVTLNLHKYKNISLKVRGQGQYAGYELFMKQGGTGQDDFPNYVHYFQAPEEFKMIRLPIKDFKPFWNGQLVEDAKPLNRSHVTIIGVVAYGGLHLTKKQYGVASLEIDWIRLD